MTPSDTPTILIRDGSCVQAIREHVPESDFRQDGAELVFTLPTAASSKFSQLFASLDAANESLRVKNYGIKMTSLEEVSGGLTSLYATLPAADTHFQSRPCCDGCSC